MFARQSDHVADHGVVLHHQYAIRALGPSGRRRHGLAHQSVRCSTLARPNRRLSVTASIFEWTPSLARMLFT